MATAATVLLLIIGLGAAVYLLVRVTGAVMEWLSTAGIREPHKEAVVCLECQTVNKPGANFCARCGRPLGPAAS